MEPAHPLTPFIFPLFFFPFCVDGRPSRPVSVESDSCSDDQPPLGAFVIDSEEPQAGDDALVSRAELEKASSPKKDHRLGVLAGVGIPSSPSEGPRRVGIEFRRRSRGCGDVSDSGAGVFSRTALAVLGLELETSREVLLGSVEVGLSYPLGEAADTMEDMLSDTAWPGRAVVVLEASLETRDKGRGMNSSVSEKPTRGALPALACRGLFSVVGVVDGSGEVVRRVGDTQSPSPGHAECGAAAGD